MATPSITGQRSAQEIESEEQKPAIDSYPVTAGASHESSSEDEDKVYSKVSTKDGSDSLSEKSPTWPVSSSWGSFRPPAEYMPGRRSELSMFGGAVAGAAGGSALAEGAPVAVTEQMPFMKDMQVRHIKGKYVEGLNKLVDILNKQSLRIKLSEKKEATIKVINAKALNDIITSQPTDIDSLFRRLAKSYSDGEPLHEFWGSIYLNWKNTKRKNQVFNYNFKAIKDIYFRNVGGRTGPLSLLRRYSIKCIAESIRIYPPSSILRVLDCFYKDRHPIKLSQADRFTENCVLLDYDLGRRLHSSGPSAEAQVVRYHLFKYLIAYIKSQGTDQEQIENAQNLILYGNFAEPPKDVKLLEIRNSSYNGLVFTKLIKEGQAAKVSRVSKYILREVESVFLKVATAVEPIIRKHEMHKLTSAVAGQ